MVNLSEISHEEKPCRLCRKHDFCFDMFTSKTSNTPISDVYLEITQIQVLKTDNLPKSICYICAQRLEDAFNLKTDAIKSFQYFFNASVEKVLQAEVPGKSTPAELPGAETTSVDNVKIENDDKEMEEVYESYEILYEIGVEPDEEDYNQEATESDNDPIGSIGETETLIDPISMLEELSEDEIDEPQDAVELLRKNGALKVQKKTKVRKTTENPKKHACTMCEKVFLRKSNLNDHMNLHLNKKPFKCLFCDKRFAQVANVRAHVRVHTKEKPFGCKLCPKTFSQSSTLNVHMRSHTQERKFICNDCDKAFISSSDLRKHEKIHKPEEQYKCGNCDRLFAQKSNLKKHMASYHSASMQALEDSIENYVV